MLMLSAEAFELADEGVSSSCGGGLLAFPDPGFLRHHYSSCRGVKTVRDTSQHIKP